MAKKIVDFLKSLVVKAGGNPEDEALKTAFTTIGAELELSDDLATAIDNGLLSISSAKNNHPDIKNHYFAQAYNGLDNELEALMRDEKLPEEVINEIKAEKSSTKRAAVLARKIKDLENKKAHAGNSEKDKLNQQIAELNDKLRQEKESIAAVKSEYEKKLKDKDMAYALRSLMGGYKTIHDELDPDTKGIILNAIIEKNLKTKNATFTVDDSGNLLLTTKDGGNLFGDDNRLLTPKAFLDKIMADEKILKVTDQNQNGNNNNSHNGPNGQHLRTGQQWQQQNGFNGNGNNGSGKKPNAALQNLISETQRDIETAQKAQIF